MKPIHCLALVTVLAGLGGCSVKDELSNFAMRVRDSVVARDIYAKEQDARRVPVTYDDRPGVAPRLTPGQSPTAPVEAAPEAEKKPTNQPPVIFYMPPAPPAEAPAPSP